MFFAKDLNLGLFDPFKDVKDDVMLDKEEIFATEETTDEEQVLRSEAMMLKFRLPYVYFLLFLLVEFWPHRPCNYDNCYFSSMCMVFLC